MTNLHEMTVDEALIAYGDGGERFSDEGMIAAGYVLAAEALRLREVVRIIKELALLRAKADVCDAYMAWYQPDPDAGTYARMETARAALRALESK